MKETTGSSLNEQKSKHSKWFKELPIWKKISITIVCAPFYYAYRGFIASTLYGWLILPIFPLLPNISTWQAAAIIIASSQFLTNKKTHKIKEEFLEIDQKLDMVIMVLKPFVILGFGYLLHIAIS